ncbi:MAG: BrnT family toxin, partial [Gemmatimonadota bacterium]|nr:BrnT family toxin [Gemmatimonadota bacterium]
MFSWNPAKAEENLRKHGISFVEASGAFSDPDVVDAADHKHSQVEPRRLLIGALSDGRVITVTYT